MTDNAVYAYMFEQASITSTRVFATEQTRHFMGYGGDDFSVIRRKDPGDPGGEPSWQDTNSAYAAQHRQPLGPSFF